MKLTEKQAHDLKAVLKASAQFHKQLLAQNEALATQVDSKAKLTLCEFLVAELEQSIKDHEWTKANGTLIESLDKWIEL
jgi:hypothetical protein